MAETSVWTPRVTVAAVIPRDGRFLVVEEEDSGRLVLNQPAGHLEQGESLLDAVRRETWEETAWRFEPSALVGVYRWLQPDTGQTFLRFAFCGHLLEHHPHQQLDPAIVRTLWLSPEALQEEAERHRSPLVWRCVQDYLGGDRFPLSCLKDLA